MALRALSIAMTVVAEAASDAPFAPYVGGLGGGGGGDHLSSPDIAASVEGATKGPINSSIDAKMAATYLNSNSVMGSTVGSGVDGEEEDGEEEGRGVQRVVIAAWLLVKEACSMLSTLVEISPPSDPTKTPNSCSYPTSTLPPHPISSVPTIPSPATAPSLPTTGQSEKGKKYYYGRVVNSGDNVGSGGFELLTVEDISLAGTQLYTTVHRYTLYTAIKRYAILYNTTQLYTAILPAPNHPYTTSQATLSSTPSED